MARWDAGYTFDYQQLINFLVDAFREDFLPVPEYFDGLNERALLNPALHEAGLLLDPLHWARGGFPRRLLVPGRCNDGGARPGRREGAGRAVRPIAVGTQHRMLFGLQEVALPSLSEPQRATM